MKAKSKTMKRVPWVAAVLTAAVLAAPAPASANEVTEEIRSQGKAAMDAMRADIRPSLPGIEVPTTARRLLDVDESIRERGRVAMRAMARDFDIVGTATAIEPPQVLEQEGFVTVSAYQLDDEATESESL